jgi:hypothetical protein
VWVLRNEDLPTALDILKAPRTSGGLDWKCRSCSAANEAQFDACWSCGAAKPSSVG